MPQGPVVDTGKRTTDNTFLLMYEGRYGFRVKKPVSFVEVDLTAAPDPALLDSLRAPGTTPGARNVCPPLWPPTRYLQGMTNIQDWWTKLPAHIRLELASDPHAPLSADAVVAITHARGIGPTLAQWNDQAPSPAHLTDAEAAWIEQGSEEDGDVSK